MEKITLAHDIPEADWYALRDFLVANGWLMSAGGGLDHSWAELTKEPLHLSMELDRWYGGTLSCADSQRDALIAELPEAFLRAFRAEP